MLYIWPLKKRICLGAGRERVEQRVIRDSMEVRTDFEFTEEEGRGFTYFREPVESVIRTSQSWTDWDWDGCVVCVCGCVGSE